jgi:hypothetical protein
MKIKWHNSLSGGHRVIKGIMAAGLITGVALIFLVPPEDFPFTTCEFHSLTGHGCLTCGMTRSLHAISHGDVTTSLRHHLMGPAVFIMMLVFTFMLSLEVLSGKRLEIDTERRGRQIVLLFGIVWLTYWGTRLMTEFMA